MLNESHSVKIALSARVSGLLQYQDKFKMENEIAHDLVFQDFEHRLDLHFSPEITESGRGYDKNDFILAGLLTWHRQFNKRILEIRQQVGITVPVEYPKNPSSIQIIKLLSGFGSDIAHTILDESKKIAVDFRLTEEWELSIVTAIVHNVILVPPKTIPIQVHIPDYEPIKEEELKTLSSILSSPSITRARKLMRITSYPSIYFTQKVTIDELKKWIDKNKKLVRIIQNRLPVRRIIKRNDKTLFWGQIAWIYKQDGINSWSSMVKKIELMIESYKKEGLIPEESEAFSDVAPEPVDLAKYYYRFVKSLEDFQKPLS